MDDFEITIQEAEAYKLCHHELGGLTHKEAAAKMGITVRRVNQLLEHILEKAPQLGPMLTPLESAVLQKINEGLYTRKIAMVLNKSYESICKMVQRLREKGMLVPSKPHRTLSYDKLMDDQIKHKF